MDECSTENECSKTRFGKIYSNLSSTGCLRAYVHDKVCLCVGRIAWKYV